MKNTIELTQTGRDAVIELDRIGGGTLIVVEGQRLVGTVTDGDIRRHIISGGVVDDPLQLIMNDTPSHVSRDGSIINHKPKIDIKLLPIVDEHGNIVDSISSNVVNLPLAQPKLTVLEKSLIDKAFDSTWISSSGRYIGEFEKRFSEQIGVRSASAVSNGTAALFLALSTYGIGKGDKVIVPDLTFAAVANAVILSGAEPIFIDIEVNRPVIDINRVTTEIDSDVKAIIVVHSYGHVVDVKRLRSLIPPHIRIIEDCAEAHFASLDDCMAGSMGDISTFSFFANKIITTGEGGMCLSNDITAIETINEIRDHGMSKSRRYWHDRWGFNFRMTNIQAAIGCAQLTNLNEIMKERRRSVKIWRTFLKKMFDTKFDFETLDGEIVGLWFYNVRFDWLDHKLLIKSLDEKNISYRKFFEPLHLMPPFKDYVKNDQLFENASKISQQGLSLPVYNETQFNDILEKKLGAT